MNTLFRLLPAVLMMLTAQLAAAAENLTQEIQEATLVRQGEPAVDFTCQDTTGRQYTLSALKGKVVVLYFFSASNAASMADLRYMQSEIFQKLGGNENFCLLAIGRDYQRDELVKLGGERKLNFPLVADPKQEIFHRYFTKFVPRTVVVSKNGTTAFQSSGSEYENILRLQSALARELSLTAP